MQIGARVSAELTATVTGPRGTRTYHGPNLVTDVGLNGAVSLDVEGNLGAIGSISRLAVGTSNTPPSPQDTGLGNLSRAVSVTSTRGNPSLTTREGWSVQSYTETATFAPDGVARNYTEVGLFGSTSTSGANARMAQRALFRDELGDPTVVTVEADEYLTVEWVTYLWRRLADETFSIDVDGVLTTVTVRPVHSTYAVNRSTGWSLGSLLGPASARIYGADTELVDHTTGPSSSAGAGEDLRGTTNTIPLGVGHVRVDVTIPPTEGNVTGGIGLVGLGYRASASFAASLLWRTQMKFDPPIPKDITKEMTLSLEFKAEAGEPPEE